LRPYGIHGRLKWRDVAHSANVSATGSKADDFAEWAVPMK